MASAADIKFYKSNNNGLGGGIDSSNQITSGTINNLFPLVTEAEEDTGITRYLLMYIKNTSAETIKDLQFWKSSDHSGAYSHAAWAKGSSGKNGSEPSIANMYTEPTGGVVWRTTNDPSQLSSNFESNDKFPIWIRIITDLDAPSTRKDVESIFKFKFTTTTPTSGGTGSDPDASGGGTGGTGGNPTPDVTDWKIAVVGDTDGTKSATEAVFDIMNSDNKIIFVGDYAYGDPDAFIDKANAHNLKAKVIGFAMGNHEEDDGYSDFCNWYGISKDKTWFSRKFQNLVCITIDSNKSLGSGSGQNDDVRAMLTTAQNDSTVDWIVACMHFPWFGSNSDHGYNEKHQVEAFHDLFAKSQKFAFMFTGHNHNWQRTHKVKYNSSDPEDPTVTDTSSPFVNDTNGLIHVVSGTGGHDSEGNLYDLDDDIGASGNPNAYQNKNHNGIYELLASNGGKTLTCRFRSIDNATFDTITYTTT